MKKIIFLFPRLNPRNPVGGYKVVYQYANMLVSTGFSVKIVYSSFPYFGHASWKALLCGFFQYIQHRIKGGGDHILWFSLDERISSEVVWRLDYHKYEKDALYVATAVDTARALFHQNIPNSNKYYFIQDFENWFYSDDEVLATYRYPLKKIVISKWLQRKVEIIGENAVVVPNGFDKNLFFLTCRPSERIPHSIAMLYHTDERKGCLYGLQVLYILKKKYPDLEVRLFGSSKRPNNIPDWISYTTKASTSQLVEIYNKSAIFLAPSIQEGWGLCVGEAMQCGCAIVCTAADGFLEMVEHGVSGLVCLPRNVDALVNNVSCLIESNALRCNMAEGALKRINEFTLEKSSLLFRKKLK